MAVCRMAALVSEGAPSTERVPGRNAGRTEKINHFETKHEVRRDSKINQL